MLLQELYPSIIHHIEDTKRRKEKHSEPKAKLSRSEIARMGGIAARGKSGRPRKWTPEERKEAAKLRTQRWREAKKQPVSEAIEKLINPTHPEAEIARRFFHYFQHINGLVEMAEKEVIDHFGVADRMHAVELLKEDYPNEFVTLKSDLPLLCKKAFNEMLSAATGMMNLGPKETFVVWKGSSHLEEIRKMNDSLKQTIAGWCKKK